jgi:hypothetical protein
LAWIESHEEIGDHPKTIRLATLLNVRIPEAVGLLHLLWHFTLRYSWRDGELNRYKSEIISKACKWHGTSNQLISALRKAGFLNGFKVHDWLDFSGRLVTDRLRYEKANADRKQSVRVTYGNPPLPVANQPYPPNQPDRTVPNPPYPTSEPVVEGVASLPETATAAERELAAVGYAKPDPKVEPERALACAYREIRKIPKNSWADWDAKHLNDFKPHLRQIINACGSLPRAYQCLKDKIEHFETQGFKHWTIRGIAKNAFQWVESHPEESHAGHLDREGVSVSDARSQRESKADALRNKHAATKVLDRIRNLPIVQSSAETANGHGDRGDEASRNGVQEDSVEGADHRIQNGKSEPEQ